MPDEKTVPAGKPLELSDDQVEQVAGGFPIISEVIGAYHSAQGSVGGALIDGAKQGLLDAIAAGKGKCGA